MHPSTIPLGGTLLSPSAPSLFVDREGGKLLPFEFIQPIKQLKAMSFQSLEVILECFKETDKKFSPFLLCNSLMYSLILPLFL